jgi:hypothetical protein
MPDPRTSAAASELRTLVRTEADRLARLSEAQASRPRAPGKWSPKEVLGHLIDSAANNHQRFVRMQLRDHLELPGYEQDAWVRLAGYADRPWADLVALWDQYNRGLAHLIGRVDPGALAHTWTSPEGERVDLAWVVRDYLSHLRHHLAQIPG